MFWSIFTDIDWRSLFCVKNLTHSKKLRITQKFFFLKLEKVEILRKILIWSKSLFWPKQWNGSNIIKNNFPPRNKPLFWSFFAKFTEKSPSVSKKLLSQKEAKNYSESNFSQQIGKVSHPEDRFWFDGNNFFGQTRETGHIYTKTVFLLKMSHIQLN